jgi:hypothetical protein
MFLVKAGTVIQIQDQNHFNWVGWKPYTTKEDKLYDKEEVWDLVAVDNGRDDIPEWARRNIVEHKKVVISREGAYAMVKPKDIKYLD